MQKKNSTTNAQSNTCIYMGAIDLVYRGCCRSRDVSGKMYFIFALLEPWARDCRRCKKHVSMRAATSTDWPSYHNLCVPECLRCDCDESSLRWYVSFGAHTISSSVAQRWRRTPFAFRSSTTRQACGFFSLSIAPMQHGIAFKHTHTYTSPHSFTQS